MLLVKLTATWFDAEAENDCSKIDLYQSDQLCYCSRLITNDFPTLRRASHHAITHWLSIAVFMSLTMCAFGALATIANAQQGSKPHVVVVGTRSVVATVVAIDQSTRMVTLERTDGKTVTFRVGDIFPNLDRVKQGDIVKAVYLESTAVSVRKADGSPTASATVEVVRHGHKPDGTIVKTTVVATVTAIDHKKRTATLKGPDGNSTEVRVGPEVRRFNEVKKGDQVVVEITEALAVSVQK